MLKSTGLILVLLFAFGSCRDRNNGIPMVAVNREINVTLPSNNALQVTGGWIYTYGGSKGLVIYRKSQEEFAVYDRHATFDINAGCVVEVDSSNISMSDPCSSSSYSMYDGSVISGNAALPLKQYNWSFDGVILYIFN